MFYSNHLHVNKQINKNRSLFDLFVKVMVNYNNNEINTTIVF